MNKGPKNEPTGNSAAIPSNAPEDVAQMLHDLVEAARTGDLAELERLLAKGLSPNEIPLNELGGDTAVWAAVYGRQPDALRLLAKWGGALNKEAGSVAAGFGVRMGKDQRPLTLTASWGHLELVRALLEGGAQVDLPNSELETPLQLAVEGKHVDVVAELLRAGADPNPPRACTSRHQLTALQYAAYSTGPPILNMLIEAGATEPRLDCLLLCGAASRGDFAEVKRLVAAGVDVNAKDSSYSTPLLHAASGANRKIMRLLLDAGADPNMTSGRGDGDGVTPLSECIDRGNLAAVQMLVEAGADPNRPCYPPDAAGHVYTPLDHAKQLRAKKIVDYLLTLKTDSGDTARTPAPARPTGVPTFETNDSCILIEAPVESVAEALSEQLPAKTWDKNALGRTVKLTKRCFAVFRIVGQPFSAIMRLNCSDVRDYPRIADARALSAKLATRSILVANSKTASISQYALFDRGKLVELFDFGSARGAANRAAVIAQFAGNHGIALNDLPNLQIGKDKVFGSSQRKVRLSSITNDLRFLTSFLENQNAFAPLFADEWGRAGQRVELTLEGLGPDDLERLDYVAV